jgi:predicted glycosyltransferase
MYCHDRFGLGHTTRTLKIASHLAENLPNCSILVLTDLSIIGRFKFPQNVDYVHLPGLTTGANQQYHAGSLNIEQESTLLIRRKITKSAAKTFQPDLLIIERDPFDLQDEMARILSFMREALPKTKVVWGWPDVIGEPQMVVDDWSREGIYQTLDRFCDEIWVYGVKQIFDQVSEYRIPAPLADKVRYTGYLRSPKITSRRVSKEIAQMNPRRPFVLITAGSGAEGYALIDNYLRYVERAGEAVPFQSMVVTGPMMLSRDKLKLKERAQKLPAVKFHRFSKHILQYVRYADLVVSTGGYNTFCEVLSYRKKAIFVPFLTPPREQLLRARIFEDFALGRLMPPGKLAPETIGEMIAASLSNSPVHPLPRRNVNISLDGLEQITERAKSLCGQAILVLHQAAS